MADKGLQIVSQNASTDSWFIWFTTFASILIFVSLFIVSELWWHLSIMGVTLFILGRTSTSPFKTLGFILVLVMFLGCLQISFSPFMRALFTKSLKEGFLLSDWQYLLFAIERFAWPLVIVSSFQSKLSDPSVLAQLTMLLTPLKWLGLKISKLQVLVILSLRFIPHLKMEWQRFAKFQTYFVSGSPRKGYLQRVKYWQSVLKAMISHTIHRSITLGDLLAIRGLPSVSSITNSPHLIWLGMAWLGIGAIALFLSVKLMVIWVIMSFWLSLLPLAHTRRALG